MLAHPDSTVVGVWAATTAAERGALRRHLRERLGEDWGEVVARRDQAARQRHRQERWNPPPSGSRRSGCCPGWSWN
ncbi:hypothetical protein [Streptomyces sp. URMC 125]|uniref:hypothetical protein n=1 Tax=Streptomyces sp. URMC 125 TaxID=3423419 RepID=UPI003F1D26EC